MTIRQRLLKWLYPLILWARKRSGAAKLLENSQGLRPTVSFYDLKIDLANGKTLALEQLRGKRVLLVNTASDCGYTRQYEELQTLYRHSREDLEIIAFPANDFKEQEKGSDAEILSFCQNVFGIGFPVARKTVVVKSEGQHPVYQWLTRKEQNGWNEQAPAWNFAKYLVNEEGVLTHYFDPGISPLDTEVQKAVHH
jgi:glutathione peroxidase